MSWNTTVLFAERKSLEDMKRLATGSFEFSTRTVTWEEASSSNIGKAVALGELSGWGVLWTLDFEITTSSELLKAASKGGRAFSLIFGGVSDTHGFILHVNRREVRRLFRMQGETVDDVGDPVAEESDLDWEDAENALFELVPRLTGLERPGHESWDAVEFHVGTRK